MVTKSMKIGLALNPLTSIQEWVHYTKLAEEIGLDCIWLTESYGKEIFSLGSLLAQKTRKLQIGLGIVNVYSRSPLLIAMASATLDEISGGRVKLGLGSGSHHLIERIHGLEFSRPLTRCKEYTKAIRMLLQGKSVDFIGKQVKIEKCRLEITPLRTSIPIYLSAIRSRMIKMAGEVADGVILFFRPLNHLDSGLKLMKEAALRAGKDYLKMKRACYVITCCSNNSKKASERARKVLAYYPRFKVYNDALKEFGFSKEADLVNNALGRGEDAAKVISEKMLGSLAIYGNPEECKEKIEEYMETDINELILYYYGVDDSSEKALKTLLEKLS